MRRLSVLVIWFGVILFAPEFSDAQDVRLTATVNRNEVGLNDQFQYSVEVSGKSTSLPDVQFPDFSDFYVLSGPNTSTSIQWVNGVMTSSKTYSFFLQPRQEGRFTLAPASITISGKTISSNEVLINVKKGAATPAPSDPQTRRSPGDEISAENLFLVARVDRNSAFLRQQIIVEYKLYFRVNVRGYNIDKLPANAGFWTEDFKMPAQPIIENEVINGINYNVATLNRVALFPTQVGELTIEPMQVTLETLVQTRRQRSLFDSFFDDPFGRTVQKTISSKPLTIMVKPLPEEGRPIGFNGAVGNYRLSVSADKREALTNEAISLKVVLSGTGNIKLVDLPIPLIPSDIEKYEPKISSDIKSDGNTITGVKSAEYILIPRIEGQYQIKPIRFSFFDPNAQKYHTLSSAAIDFNIEKRSGTIAGVTSQPGGFSRQQVKLLGQDIRFIKEFSEFRPMRQRIHLSLSIWASILSGIILFIGFVAMNSYQVKLSSNELLLRSRKAGKHAAKILSAAKKQLNAADQSAFYRAISQALQVFVRDKLGLELTEFSTENVRHVLEKRQINKTEIEDYLSVLKESDLRQFANMTSDLDERKEIYNRAKDILTRLEKWM